MKLEDFQKLQDKLYTIGKKANKAVVTVTGVTSSIDWFDTPYENENRSAGIIIGNNGEELLILTEKKIIADAQEINITFIDETEVSASLKKYDGNTGIATERNLSLYNGENSSCCFRQFLYHYSRNRCHRYRQSLGG